QFLLDVLKLWLTALAALVIVTQLVTGDINATVNWATYGLFGILAVAAPPPGVPWNNIWIAADTALLSFLPLLWTCTLAFTFDKPVSFDRHIPLVIALSIGILAAVDTTYLLASNAPNHTVLACLGWANWLLAALCFFYSNLILNPLIHLRHALLRSGIKSTQL